MKVYPYGDKIFSELRNFKKIAILYYLYYRKMFLVLNKYLNESALKQQKMAGNNQYVWRNIIMC